MWKQLVLFVALGVASVYGQSTAASQCVRHDAPLPLNVYVEGCEVPPCVLPQLQDAVINVIFKAPRTIRSMKTEAVALLPLGSTTIALSYPLGEYAETCNFLTNSYCPIMEDEVIGYTLKMMITRAMPADTGATVEFVVSDQDSEAVFCIRMQIRISEPVDNNAQ